MLKGLTHLITGTKRAACGGCRGVRRRQGKSAEGWERKLDKKIEGTAIKLVGIGGFWEKSEEGETGKTGIGGGNRTRAGLESRAQTRWKWRPFHIVSVGLIRKRSGKPLFVRSKGGGGGEYYGGEGGSRLREYSKKRKTTWHYVWACRG